MFAFFFSSFAESTQGLTEVWAVARFLTTHLQYCKKQMLL